MCYTTPRDAVGNVMNRLLEVLFKGRGAAVFRRSAFLLSAAACLGGCGLDERVLVARDPSGGSASGGAGSSGSSSSAGRAPGWDAPAPPACAYLGGAVDDGCETLVSNPGFDQGVVGWPGESLSMQIAWAQQDATDSAQSGSLSVENTLYGDAPGEVISGALQCIGATAGAVYDIAAEVFIPAQSAAGRAGLSVFFYKKVDCNASLSGTDMSFTTDLVTETEVWTPVSGRFVIPNGFNSMEVRLVAGKDFKLRSFKVLFDNVLVQRK